MSRRFISGLVVMVLGLLAIGGSAAANPTYAPATISVTFNGGDQYTVNLGNFGLPSGADTSITLSVTYGGPSGLRNSPALAAAAAKAESYSLTPDVDGNATTVIHVTQSGTIFFTGTGSPSGKIASTSVVHPSDTGTGNAGNAAGAADSDDSVLPSTGANIAGPVAVGILALVAGLALLFFGTRGIPRRKSVGSQR